ncbi:MAG: SIMPL domain-containing protein [Candidatus Paceibacterota bacterium]
MNQNIKNVLGAALVVGILVLGYSAFSYVNYYGKSIQPSSFRSFSAVGEGKIIAIPDVAVFTFSVLTEGDKDVAGLQTKNTDKVNKAIEFVKSSGVNAKDIKTQGYNLSPRYQYSKCNEVLPMNLPSGTEPSAGFAYAGVSKICPPAEIVGYTITQTIQVKARDFTKVGDILSGVVSRGVNNVSQLSFQIDDPSAVQEQAREQAIQKAKARAEKVADAAGFKLGRLLSVDEGYAPYHVYNSKFDSSAAGVALPENSRTQALTVEPGSQEVTVDVTLRYEIE